MKLLLCLLISGGVAWGRQQAVSYQNFRASHGQGHPTYSPDGSWSQRFGGPPRGSFLPVARPFLSLPQAPPVPPFNGYFEPPPQHQPLVTYPAPTPVADVPSPQVHHNNYGSSPHYDHYSEPLATAAPPHVEPQPSYPVNSPVPSFQPRGNEQYPTNEGHPTPIYNDFSPGPRVESIPPSYSPDHSKSNYQLQNNGNSYVNEHNFHNYEEPKRDFGPPISDPTLQTLPPYNGPVTDLRNDHGPVSELLPHNENPVSDLRGNDRPVSDLSDRPLTDVRNGNGRPGSDLSDRPLTDVRNGNGRPGLDLNDRPLTDIRNGNGRPGLDLNDRPLTDIRNGNGRPGSDLSDRPLTDVRNGNVRPAADLRNNERPLADLRTNNLRPQSEIRNNNEKRPADFRPHHDRSDTRFNINRPHFANGGSPSDFGAGVLNEKFGPQGVTNNKQFKPSQPADSPLHRQHGPSNGRSSIGPLDTNLGPSSPNQPPIGTKSFNREEKKPASNQSFRQKDNDRKPDFSEEDKNQSFESDFQSAEIGGQSFEADIPDFGSDESYFNSQEGYGSFESSGERKGSYEQPPFNSQEDKRNNFKSNTGPTFQTSADVTRGTLDGPADPRINQKLGSEGEVRSRIGTEDKKIGVEDKKSAFPVIGDKKPSLRTSSTIAPSKDTLPLANKKLPHLAPFRPSPYVPFIPIDKPFRAYPNNQ